MFTVSNRIKAAISEKLGIEVLIYYESDSYSSIGTAEATNSTLCPSVEPEEWKNMNVQTVTHGFQLLVIDLKKYCIWVLFSNLTDLITKKRNKNR